MHFLLLIHTRFLPMLIARLACLPCHACTISRARIALANDHHALTCIDKKSARVARHACLQTFLGAALAAVHCATWACYGMECCESLNPAISKCDFHGSRLKANLVVSGSETGLLSMKKHCRCGVFVAPAQTEKNFPLFRARRFCGILICERSLRVGGRVVG